MASPANAHPKGVFQWSELINNSEIIHCDIQTGTGKTITGAKIAYWFTKLNSSSRTERLPGDQPGVALTPKQVLYCAPTNNAVDVAASEWTLHHWQTEYFCDYVEMRQISLDTWPNSVQSRIVLGTIIFGKKNITNFRYKCRQQK